LNQLITNMTYDVREVTYITASPQERRKRHQLHCSRPILSGRFTSLSGNGSSTFGTSSRTGASTPPAQGNAIAAFEVGESCHAEVSCVNRINRNGNFRSACVSVHLSIEYLDARLLISFFSVSYSLFRFC
jgi:hypothetical protein